MSGGEAGQKRIHVHEVLVPAGVMAILASLLLPIPPALIDFLLVINLLLAVVLLASALYVTEPLKLSSLPTMLLLATLYRLALNVSTTRLILNSGEAGQVIEAFGQVVIQGNLVVGAVVFLIITIIQFLVIAKGAERVAEVAARFTLDALPGKQMSIDADVRAGLVDFETARARRQELQTESRFYGALDGAMKFIKGDAIAGLIVTAINSIGGIAVGLFFLNLDLSQSVHRFTMLTVGDGLVSQMPALLNALAAGIIVTRVTRGDGESLARELPRQLLQLRSVGVLVALVALGLGTVPGMPALPFISLALVFLIAAMTSTGGPNPKEITVPKFQPRIPPLLQIEVGKCLAKPLYELGTVTETLETFRQKVFDESGVMLAAAEVSVDAALDSAFRIRMRGLEVHSEKAEGAPLEILERIVQKLDELVKSRLAEFVDDILTRRTLDQFDKEAPELVAAVVPGIVSVTQLTEILRALVKDGLTIRNLDLILQAVAETGPKAPHERVLLQETRVALRRLISARHRSSDGKIYALSVSALHDVAICSCEKEVRQIEPALTTKLAAELRKRDLEGKVLLASKGARRLLQEAVENMGFSIKAIAYEELEPEVEVTHEAILLPSALEEAELLEALAA